MSCCEGWPIPGISVESTFVCQCYGQDGERVRQEALWTKLFADDLASSSGGKQQAEENVKRWRYTLKCNEMKIPPKITVYLCLNESETGTIKLKGQEMRRTDEYQYLRVTLENKDKCKGEVRKWTQAE